MPARSRWVPFIVMAALLSLGFPAATQAQDDPPPGLTGEVLEAYNGQADFDCRGPIIGLELPPDTCRPLDVAKQGSASVVVECNPDGSGTVSYTATGIAVGPYPGTFTETGTLVFSADLAPVGPSFFGRVVTEFTATFEIESAVGHVTGRKFLVSSESSLAICEQSPAGTGTFVLGLSAFPAGTVRYEAHITTADGRFIDRGTTALIGGAHDDAPRPLSNYFLETYWSEGVEAAPGPATVTLTPPAAVNEVGTQHTVTATVADADGDPSSGVDVRFRVTGSTTTSGTCTTNSAGQCSFTYTGPQLPGADVITGCADANDNGATDPGEPCGEALKAWVLPTTTAGQVTGGGWIIDPADNERVSFGFNAQNRNGTLKGNCTVVDAAPARNVKVKCLDVTALVQAGTHATFFGRAEVNGVLTDYRIDVDDLGEPGRGRDTFKIVTGTGYSAAGVLDGGNIQIHDAD